MVWTLAAILVIGLSGALALQVAIARNGPAVLTFVDRVSGGSPNTALKASISLGPSSAQKLLVWGPDAQPQDERALPVLIFVHGGSWRSGDPADYGFVARSFVPEGFVTVLVGYRLHPEAVFPAMLEDTAAAIAWTMSEIGRFGGDPARIILVGHSAGAYNVVMTALDDRWLSQHGISTIEIAGVVGLSGPYDFFPFDSDSTRNAFGSAPDPAATQPIEYAEKVAPPLLLIHGEDDDLVKPRNSQELAKRMRNAGAPVTLKTYQDMSHNDPLISLASPWRNSRTVRNEIVGFAKNLEAKPRPSVPVQRDMR